MDTPNPKPAKVATSFQLTAIAMFFITDFNLRSSSQGPAVVAGCWVAKCDARIVDFLIEAGNPLRILLSECLEK